MLNTSSRVEGQQVVLIDRDWQSDVLDQSLDDIEDDPSDEIAQTLNQTISHHDVKVNELTKISQNPQETLSATALGRQGAKTVVIEGEVIRKVDGIIRTQKRRYLVLTGEKLQLFEGKDKFLIIACINLKLLAVVLFENQNQDICLHFKHCNQPFTFQPILNANIWLQEIQRVIHSHSKHRKVSFQGITEQISGVRSSLIQNSILAEAQTGDLLLLSSLGALSGLQRLVTQSDYDHVAMLVRCRDQLKIFESNQDHGVHLYDWHQYFKIFNQYQNIAYRKLHYLRKIDAESTLLKFVKKNIGHKYQINCAKMIKINSNAAWEDQHDRSYFCSELVAKAYKAISVLESKKSSAKYWPIDFTQKSGLMLSNGAYLGSEKIVILNKYLTQV